MAIQILDDLSDNEKNVQMMNLNSVEELVNQPDRVRDFDTEKIERIEKNFRKLRYNNFTIL